MGQITRSCLSALTAEQLAYRRRRAADPHAPEHGRCRFGAGPGEPASCLEEAVYEWHATRSDASGRPGLDWHFELTEALCKGHAADRTGGRSVLGDASEDPATHDRPPQPPKRPTGEGGGG